MKRIFLTTVLSIGLFLNLLYAQRAMVLDAPFIYSNFHLFQSNPQILFDQWEDGVFYNVPYSSTKDSLKGLEKDSPLYLRTYLNSEPEYIRSRVYKASDYQELEAELEQNTTSWFYKNENGGYANSLGETINVEYQNIWSIRNLYGVDFEDVRRDTHKYSRGKNILFNMEETMDAMYQNGLIVKEENKYYANNEFGPDSIKIAPFHEVILDDINDGIITPYRYYKKGDYYTTLSKNEANKILEGKGFDRILFQEDYHRNLLNGSLTSSIIWLGLVAKEGKEIVWFYYPEVRYGIHDYYTVYNDTAVQYDVFFDEHLFNMKVIQIKHQHEYGLDSLDYAYSVKLDPLVSIQLHKELVNGQYFENGNHVLESKDALKKLKLKVENNQANGEIEEYYANDNICFKGLMKNGKCEGEFRFYYEDGSLKAIRNYKDGLLQGKQFNYYPNGVMYANYEVKNELRTYLKRQYADGSLLEEGFCKEGLQIGDWTYRIKCGKETIQILKKYHEYFLTKPIDIEESSFKYKINYQWDFKRSAPPYITLYNSFNVNLNWKFIE